MEISKKLISQCNYIGNRCFIKEITLKWSVHLTEEDLREQISDAMSLLQFIALVCDGEERISHNLYTQGHCLFDALLFLSRNDVDELMYTLLHILQNLGSNLTLNLKLCNVSLRIRNVKPFQTLVIIAVSHILRRFCKFNSHHTVMLQLIRSVLGTLNSLATSPLCVCCLNVLHTLVKKAGAQLHICQADIIQHMYLFIKAVHHKQATKCADEVLGLVIKQMSTDDKLILFKKISRMAWWNKGECAIVIHLINYWPTNVKLRPFICAMTTRLAVMLLENVTDHSIKLLRIIITHISLDVWQDAFIPNIVIVVESHCDNEWDIISKTISQCVKVGVLHFKSQMYNGIRSSLLFSCYSAIVLYHSIEQDCLNINDYREDIVKLLHSPNATMQYYALKAVCNFNRKRSQLTDWHVDCIKYYLQSALFSSNNFYDKELHYFLSHLVMQANQVLISEQVAQHHIEFMQWLYEMIRLALLSKSSRRIKVGTQILTLVQSTVVRNDQRIKYKIEDSINPNLFFAHLRETNQWPCMSDGFYMEILESWLVSKKVYPELYTLIESQSNVYIKTCTTINQSFENKLDKESIMKANFCILNLIKSCPSKKESLVTNIVTRWHSIALSSSDRQIDVHGVALVYGLTLCVSLLLQRNLLIGDYPLIFDTCLQIGRNLLGKDSTDNVLVLKNVEQTLVAMMDVLCFILKTVRDDAIVRRFFEFLGEIMEQGSGKSVTCAVAGALHTICRNIFETSVDLQAPAIQYLDFVLNSMYRTSEVKISKLRKNPEHRLIIHSVVSAEKYPTHPNLHHSMDFMLDVVSSPYPKHNMKESALHTFEILISDSNLVTQTSPYITRIAIHAIEGFSSSFWNVKNASIQVLQALMNRLLGQKNSLTNRRRYGIDDLVLLYPDLILYFITQLYGSIDVANCDSIIAILGLLSESYYSSFHAYLDKNVAFIHKSLQTAFIYLIRTSETVGYFAANAYAALYPSTFVPDIICDISTWLKLNFTFINQNVFASVMSLLATFRKTFHTFHYDETALRHKIDSTFRDLELFLKQFNKYEMSLYNFLGIQLNSYRELQEKTIVMLSNGHNFANRIWLNNNLIRVLNNIDIADYPSFLERILGLSVNLMTVKQCVNSIITRYSELVDSSLTSTVLKVMLLSLMGLTHPNDFVLITYTRIILSLLASEYCYSCSENFIVKLRSYCVTGDRNLYKLSVYIAMLAHCSSYVEDSTLLHEIALLYKHSTLCCDIELQMFLSSTLMYLYNCVGLTLRPLVYEIAFILLFVPECSLEVSRFLSFVFETPYCELLTVLVSFLSAHNLSKSLESPERTLAFLNNLKRFVLLLGDEFEDCGMFYMRQNEEICSHKLSILKLLDEQIDIASDLLAEV
ncbi:hypothetical protein PPYR_05953 [Photinus pyralis]|uniref:DUF2428 domain-containing protein n=1 Tax=Photinus pyralis TaxID=7054 RepID=A0A1Y1LVE9_PHOPY|nr:uncharacterized protein LOC116166634 [Photinus pyralis]KAB0800213.1 hypothetical protein PPYR_05953 [Photinus pyralis]